MKRELMGGPLRAGVDVAPGILGFHGPAPIGTTSRVC